MNVRLVLVVVLAFLAGCSALGTPGDTQTVTPAPVPESTETTDRSPLPPGVTGNGVTDPEALAQAHVSAVKGLSYTWHDRVVVLRVNSGGDSEIRQRAHVQNETRFDYWTNRREADRDSAFSYLGTFSEYADSSGRYTRSAERGDLIYEQVPHRTARQRIGQRARSSIVQYLSVENATVAVTVVDGSRHYEITADDYSLPSGWVVQNYTVTAVVSPDGLVRSLNASYERTRGRERQWISYSFRYSAIGNTTVEEPAWVSQRWQTNATDRSLDD